MLAHYVFLDSMWLESWNEIEDYAMEQFEEFDSCELYLVILEPSGRYLHFSISDVAIIMSTH